jgi:hypothetical protein
MSFSLDKRIELELRELPGNNVSWPNCCLENLNVHVSKQALYFPDMLRLRCKASSVGFRFVWNIYVP